MSPAEKAHALTLLESGKAELALPTVGGAQAMKQVLVDAAEIAVELKRIIEENGLSKAFREGAKPYVFSDGWLTASRIQNESTFSEVMETVTDPDTGYQTVHAKGWLEDSSGRIVARADGYCSSAEAKWQTTPFYARASMAQTRAIAKAMRIRHAWIMVMAGYSPTPAEEMEGVELEHIPAPLPPLVAPKPAKAKPQIPPGEKLKIVKVKPEDSKLHPPEPKPQEDAETLTIVGFSNPEGQRMGVRVIFQDGSQDWANSWHDTDHALIKERVLAAKREASESGVDPRSAGATFVAKLKRKPRPDGGFWVDISDLVEVTGA